MIKVEWGDRAETILKWTFSKQWTAEQFHHAVEQSNTLVQLKPHTVDVIAELESILFVPSNLVTMAQHGLKTRPANIGLIVIVSTSNFWSRIYDKVSGVREAAGGAIHFARSLDEACAVIGMHKARLAQIRTANG